MQTAPTFAMFLKTPWEYPPVNTEKDTDRAIVTAAPGILCFLTVKKCSENEEEKNKNLKIAKIIAILVLCASSANFLSGIISAAATKTDGKK